MKSLLIILLLTVGVNSWALNPHEIYPFDDANQLHLLTKKQKITVMVGLGLDHMSKDTLGVLKPLIARYPKEISSWFKNFYKKDDFEIDIMFYPSRFNIWSVLNDPANVAVFWVGHGSSSVSGDNKMFDGDGFDITDAFSTVHPNLRFFGFIGCYSKESFKRLDRDFQVKKSNPELRIINFDNQVRLDQAIKTSLLASRKILNSKSVKNGYQCQTRKKTGIK